MLSASLIAPVGVASSLDQRNSAAGRLQVGAYAPVTAVEVVVSVVFGTQVLSLTVMFETSARWSLLNPESSVNWTRVTCAPWVAATAAAYVV